MIEKFGAEQVVDVELVPGKDVKDKQKQKFFSNNIGKYFYDITDNTIKKIIKNPEDPTGKSFAIETFDSETLSPIDDPAPDIDKTKTTEKISKEYPIVDTYTEYPSSGTKSTDAVEQAIIEAKEGKGAEDINKFWDWVVSDKSQRLK